MSRSRNQHSCGRKCPVCNRTEREHSKYIVRKAPVKDKDESDRPNQLNP